MISLKEAQENVTRALENKKSSEEVKIENKLKELLGVADRFIKKSSMQGQCSAGLCIPYALDDYDILYEASRRASKELNTRGYTSRVSENTDIKTILLDIEWDC